MKTGTVTALVSLLAAAVGCDGFLGPGHGRVQRVDDVSFPDSVRALYAEDAARLAVRHLQATESPARGDVELPGSLLLGLTSALARVHNATELPARDSVIAVYRIHTFPRPEVQYLIVGLDPEAPWISSWSGGQRLTGDERVDSLVLQWDLTVDHYYTFSWGHTAVLRSSKPLNMFALGTRFETIEGVLDTHPYRWCCDGDDITAHAAADAWILEYSIGRGDCMAGCAHRCWTFLVAADGTVRFLTAGPCESSR